MKFWEVGIPSDETWVFEILAKTAEEALEIAKRGQYSNGDPVNQTHSLGGAETFVKYITKEKP